MIAQLKNKDWGENHLQQSWKRCKKVWLNEFLLEGIKDTGHASKLFNASVSEMLSRSTKTKPMIDVSFETSKDTINLSNQSEKVASSEKDTLAIETFQNVVNVLNPISKAVKTAATTGALALPIIGIVCQVSRNLISSHATYTSESQEGTTNRVF